MQSDLRGAELLAYTSSQLEPSDFDSFWRGTLEDARLHDSRLVIERVFSPVNSVQIYDCSFSGYNGEQIRGWLRRPHESGEKLPVLVEFVGYGGGRGIAEDNLFWASAGYVHLQMDTRGQGGTWSPGSTPDLSISGPRVPGMMTSGIESRDSYYYRRLITDAVRAVDAVLTLDQIDSERVVTLGVSQGGGLALAVAGLHSAVTDMVAYVPFLCDFPRAITITDRDPYKEISRLLSVIRDQESEIARTLSYFDGVNFAKRSQASAQFTAGLMDDVCPPSTVVAAFNAYKGPKEIRLFPHSGHEHSIDEDVETWTRLRLRGER